MLFGKSKEKWEELNGYYTASEINQQPKTWMKTFNQVKKENFKIHDFIDTLLHEDDFEVILTGAGTSEYVGNSLCPYLNKIMKHNVRSYGTTDIVLSPEDYLDKEKPTLMISFARSGNSPESVAAVNLANQICENIKHIFITCNKNGELAKLAERENNCYALVLSDEINDQSFAMTSSFSNMYLATVLIFSVGHIDSVQKELEIVCNDSMKLLEDKYSDIFKIVKEFDFNRIVYLGSHINKGVSQESALKMCELTAGKVDTNFETPMGFRHGPKSIINDKTLTIIYISNEEYTYKYELDLIKEIKQQQKNNKLLIISGRKDEELMKNSDYFISFENSCKLQDIFLGIEYIIVAQLLALFKSVSYNITPDNPCPSGEVNRVVKGVNIYKYY